MEIRACMLDGFGWFTEADYRRTWLLFDSVDYVLPNYIDGLIPRPSVFHRADVNPTILPLDPVHSSALLGAARRSLDEPAVRRVIAEASENDRSYAHQVVTLDADLGHEPSVEEPELSLAYLALKLLLVSQARGAVPIVGRRYARRLLSTILSSGVMPGVVGGRQGMTTPLQGVKFHAIGAGLSLSFLDDADIMKHDLDGLARFKEESAEVRRAHRLELLRVAQAFEQLPHGPRFEEALNALRVETALKRRELDHAAKAQWRSLRLQLAEKSLIAGASGVVTALGLLKEATLSQLISAIVPAGLVGLGTALAAGMKAKTMADEVRRSSWVQLFDVPRRG